jgi:hypothetical protein
MAQTRTKSASPRSRKRAKPAISDDPARVQADAATIRQALDDLGINRPYTGCRVVGGRLELTLYGGDVVTWPPEPEAKPKRSRARRKPK